MSPATGALDSWDGTPVGDLEKIQKLAGMPWEESSELVAPKTGQPQDNSGMQVSGSSSPVLKVIPAPDSPTLPVQLPSSTPLSVQHPPPVSSFDKNCTPPQAPVVGHGKYGLIS